MEYLRTWMVFESGFMLSRITRLVVLCNSLGHARTQLDGMEFIQTLLTRLTCLLENYLQTCDKNLNLCDKSRSMAAREATMIKVGVWAARIRSLWAVELWHHRKEIASKS